MSLSKLRAAAAKSPIDWPTILGERLTYEREAKTAKQRAAATHLRAANDSNILSAIAAIEAAFPEGRGFGENGWPR